MPPLRHKVILASSSAGLALDVGVLALPLRALWDLPPCMGPPSLENGRAPGEVRASPPLACSGAGSRATSPRPECSTGVCYPPHFFPQRSPSRPLGRGSSFVASRAVGGPRCASGGVLGRVAAPFWRPAAVSALLAARGQAPNGRFCSRVDPRAPPRPLARWRRVIALWPLCRGCFPCSAPSSAGLAPLVALTGVPCVCSRSRGPRSPCPRSRSAPRREFLLLGARS